MPLPFLRSFSFLQKRGSFQVDNASFVAQRRRIATEINFPLIRDREPLDKFVNSISLFFSLSFQIGFR